MAEYRERCYKSFVSTHWVYTHSLSKDEYELLVKIYRERFKNILPRDKSAQIVDIACGAGHFLYFLQKEGYVNTLGIDMSDEQLAIAKKAGVVNIEKGDLFDFLKRNPGKFDVIIANDIIEHLYKDEVLDFLDTIYASLKPNRLVIIATLNAASLFGSNFIYIDFTHEVGFTPESLMQVMRLCNFMNVNVYGETPIIHDIRSFIRAVLWSIVKGIIKIYTVIERGTGRELWKNENIFEPRIFAVGKKKA